MTRTCPRCNAPIGRVKRRSDYIIPRHYSEGALCEASLTVLDLPDWRRGKKGRQGPWVATKLRMMTERRRLLHE